MDPALHHQRHHLRFPSVGVVSALEALALGVLAFILVFVVIPDAFSVDWGCVGRGGLNRTAGDTYVSVFAVFGTVGWFVALGATTVANAVGKPKLALAIPFAWFSGLTLGAVAVAASIGPLPC